MSDLMRQKPSSISGFACWVSGQNWRVTGREGLSDESIMEGLLIKRLALSYT
jgi:hypothetical protein